MQRAGERAPGGAAGAARRCDEAYRPDAPRNRVRQADAAGAAAGFGDEDPDDEAEVDVLDAPPDAAGVLPAVDDVSDVVVDEDEDRPEEDEDDDERASLR
ncbi:hypothetical protein [Cellulomonas sp. zg-ZUI22]|uniref:hypothetical protein n=1 Tax=Cellulomonas sp. zg-ZUI22 TaxID=2816955 RepID=UPI0027DBE71C|nr:hypothetical protein [Cellulomonas sp. zg-ZUI22]